MKKRIEFYVSKEDRANLSDSIEGVHTNKVDADSYTVDDDEKYFAYLDELVITRGIPLEKAIGNAVLRSYLRDK